MRLIDADALEETMYREAFETDSDMQRWDSGCWIRYKMFENAIEAAPTIDPVKHGKWIMLSYDEAVCDCCGYNRNTPFYCTKEAKEHWTDLPPFCEMCGAKMDGGVNDETD